MISRESQKAIVLKIELATILDDMYFTEEMVVNIGKVIVISKPVEYMKDFYTIEGDDNYNAYHISWLYFINQQPKLSSEVEEAIVDNLLNELEDTGSIKDLISKLLLIKKAFSDKDEYIKELQRESDLTLHTLCNRKDGTVTLSSERYEQEERELINTHKKLKAIEEVCNKYDNGIIKIFSGFSKIKQIIGDNNEIQRKI